MSPAGWGYFPGLGFLVKKGFRPMRVKLFLLLSLLTFLIAPVANGQSGPAENVQENSDQLLASEKLWLLSDLRGLDEQTLKLDAPLSRARVKAEIADAAWALDPEWAKALLTKAYELTFPDEDERVKLRNRTVGSPPPPPLSVDSARRIVRNRVMRIASREKAFADQLIRLGVEQLGNFESHMTYATLAENARQEHDIDAAGQYLLRALDGDPSQITAGFILVDIAKNNRTGADKLIVEYLNRLRSFPLARTNGSISRIYFVVHRLVFPPAGTAPPGPAVMRAYVSYVIQSFGNLEEREPGSLAGYRELFLRAWPALRQYAPDLAADFMSLEQRGRGPNDTSSLPTLESLKSKGNGDYEARIKDAIESDRTDEIIVKRAISRGDFSKARKLIDKFPEGPQKTQLTDMVNVKEALSLLKSDDLMGARLLAEKLKRALSILEVYPALIGKCVGNKDQICATSLVLQAIKQLKSSDTALPTLPADIPSSVAASMREFDPILEGMSKLTLAILPLNDEIALIGLDETVAAANVNQVDTGQGRIGFDVSIFRKFAPKNEARAKQAADSFKDPFRRIVSLAAIYQWKAADLDIRATKARANEKKIR
jgi:hypothetical protein